MLTRIPVDAYFEPRLLAELRRRLGPLASTERRRARSQVLKHSCQALPSTCLRRAQHKIAELLLVSPLLKQKSRREARLSKYRRLHQIIEELGTIKIGINDDLASRAASLALRAAETAQEVCSGGIGTGIEATCPQAIATLARGT